MEMLQNMLDQSQYAFLTAILLGLMTAISPCPLATNISAIGFISRDLAIPNRVFLNGLVYTLGRMLSYTGLAVVLYLGASKLNVAMLFQGWGEKVLGPMLIVIGLFQLEVWSIKFPGFSKLSENIGEKGKGSYWSSFLLGMVFALAFCPYSGVLYFAMLIPMTISSSSGLYLPVLYAMATGLPVIVFAWLLAFSIGKVAKLYNGIKLFERWFRKVVGFLFIAVGFYYLLQFLF